jgi:hypothetical protein
MANSEVTMGGCLCGEVRYIAEKPLYDLHYCHCRKCQKASGAPVIAGAFISSDGLRFTREQPKMFKSSPIVERGFCSNCGTYLLYQPVIEEWSNWVIITIASLDNPENYAPQRHYGIESKLPWFGICDELPREPYENDFIETLANGSPEERQAILDRFGQT